jgi:hypothetical protein
MQQCCAAHIASSSTTMFNNHHPQVTTIINSCFVCIKLLPQIHLCCSKNEPHHLRSFFSNEWQTIYNMSTHSSQDMPVNKHREIWYSQMNRLQIDKILKTFKIVQLITAVLKNIPKLVKLGKMNWTSEKHTILWSLTLMIRKAVNVAIKHRWSTLSNLMYW